MVARKNRVLTIVAMLAFAIMGAYAIAQPGASKAKGKGGVGSRADGPMKVNVGNTQLLLNEKVRQELDISDEQVGQIRALSERFRRRALGKASTGKGRDNSEELKLMEEEFATELSEILRPDQIERFHQIEIQQELQKDVLEALTAKGKIGETLGVTDEQRKQLRAVSRESDEKLREEYQRLQAEARQSVIDALTPEQKEQLAKMIGDPFELDWPNGPGRGAATGTRSKGKNSARPK